jgi:hypothetical protein
MTGSWALDPQPTARETRDIVFRLGHELAVRGAQVNHDIIGGFRFRMPLLREAAHGGGLHAIFSGRVTIGAGLGEPWRVRYELRFTLLTILTLLLSVGIVTVGIHWPRGRLLELLGLLWVVAYGIPCVRAMRMFRALVREAVAETVKVTA